MEEVDLRLIKWRKIGDKGLRPATFGSIATLVALLVRLTPNSCSWLKKKRMSGLGGEYGSPS